MNTVTYAVGREKVREFARAVGEADPRFHDVEAARAAGFADVVAPPMFASVYAGPAVFPVVPLPAESITPASAEAAVDTAPVATTVDATASAIADFTPLSDDLLPTRKRR